MAKKIAWLTPLGPHSDIGAHSLCVVEAMHRRAPDYDCEVALFVQPNGSIYRSTTPRFPLDESFDPAMLSLFDVPVLNIGNNQENHLVINQIALQQGGIIVVHDIVMQHYLAWSIFEKAKRPGRYVDIMAEHYGVRALDVLEVSGITFSDQPTRYAPWDTPHAFSFPLIEPFLQRARAVVVHSQFAADIVAQITDRPQLRLFLPSDKKAAPKRQPTEGAPITFAALGHISSAKHIHYCIEAFRDSALLRDKAQMLIVGGANDSDYIAYLQQLVREGNLAQWVRFEFNVSEERLFEVKAETDVFVNIRYPNTESASGSLAEQMACGAPVIVYDSGCYRELPDETVLKIRDLSSSDPLRHRMEELAADPALRLQYGLKALRYGQDRTADAYARQFLDYISEPNFEERSRLSLPAPPYPELGWLKPALGNLLVDPLPVPWFARGGNTPRFASLARLEGLDLLRYLALSVFQRSLPKHGMRRASMILAGQPRHKVSLCCGRIGFLLSICQSERVLQPAEIDFENDALALAVIEAVRPDLFIDICYRAVLGRLPFEGEVDRYLQRVTRDQAGSIVAEFAASEECRQRGMQRDMLHGLRELAERINALQPSRSAEGAVLPVDKEVLLGDLASSGLFTNGWHEAEVEGIWSCSRRAVISFATTLEDKETALLIRLQMRLAAIEWSGPQTVVANINGEDVARQVVNSGERFVFDVPLLEQDLSEVLLTLIIERTIRLAEHLPNGDQRELGLFLYGVSVVKP
ncbi:glycosyltransferase family 4 protein [Teichococcus oryzae]|uniref:Glycosyltransferase n=1 Tax=Teichococcus oryzae TaxID=1608942 RepID=A0A5B2TB41_9PROT|nr:glycosyltransferase [Pseudoroseomonas oryzae]KAA2211409.1 glycosyltransferase [Pseudoroseomonas oryzae]